jgi:putative selenate reductase
MAELTPIPFDRLLQRIFYEFKKTESIFDLSSKKFYRPGNEYDLSVNFLGKNAANSAGPAAGPHTQLTQNIILAWLAGSRIMELKTVQIKDRLELTRPCIDMATIGYNTEWSQELLLDESLREYVKASMIIEILKQWIFLSDESITHHSRQFDTIFDLSVGYDLAGIQSVKIRNWLHSMRNANSLIDEYRKQIPPEFSAYKDLYFNPEIGNSITLSTFHGTKAEEIESICQFLITEMDFNVVIKMNPPMLGKEKLEHLLHDRLGFSNIEVNENAYKVNIAYPDAVELAKRLQETASKQGRMVGVKFGNTLEVINKGNFLKDKVQYLSGQPLHILHLELVNEWRRSFGANFPVSFSAGVDASNFADCVSIGLVPVTACTDLLRPRGYGRLPQYLQNLELKMKANGSKNIKEFIVRSNNQQDVNETAVFEKAVMSNTSELLKRSIENPRYHYSNNKKEPRKVGSHLVSWDCLNCDKCLPVCPNDANFCIDLEPVDLKYFVVEVNENGWNQTEGGNFKIEKVKQIANFADACNECGNCDVFCPEDGGPYIEKPRFFGSLNSFRYYKNLSGFYLDIKQNKSTLTGRFKNREFELIWDPNLDRCVFSSGTVAIETNASTHKIKKASLINAKTGVIDMQYYHAMSVLMKGMLNTSHVNFVNIDAHQP